jgi:hypothetical protein
MIAVHDVVRGPLLPPHEPRRPFPEPVVAARRPRLGRLLINLATEPRTTITAPRKVTAAVVRDLQRRTGPDVDLLVDRRAGTDDPIDVLAVTANGVHVIDVRRHARAEVRVRTLGGVHQPATEHLFLGGRDRTRVVGAVERQGDVVLALLDAIPGGGTVPVYLSMCLVDADLPLMPLRVNGIALVGPTQLVRRLNEPGPVHPDLRDEVLRHLDAQLPPA